MSMNRKKSKSVQISDGATREGLQTHEQQPGPIREMSAGRKLCSSQTTLVNSSYVSFGKKALATRNGPASSTSLIPIACSKASLESLNHASANNLYRASRRSKSIDFPSNLKTPNFSTTSSERSRSISSRMRRPVTISGRESTMQWKYNQFPGVPGTWRVLANSTNMTSLMFMEMIKFVASFLVGNHYFVKGREEDNILELTELLNYPGQLYKSHLKNSAAQHAWPGHLVFLAWLCCRVQAISKPEVESSAVTELCNEDYEFKRVKFESLINLIPHKLKNTLDEDVIEKEMTNYMMKLEVLHGVEGNVAMEELQRKKSRAFAQLEQLNIKVNVAEDARNRLQISQKDHKILCDSVEEAEMLVKKYSDLTPLLLQKEGLDTQIFDKLKEIKGLEQQVKSQSLCQDATSKMLQDIADLKKEVLGSISVNAKLKLDLEKKIQMLKNVEKKFYNTCSRFICVDMYNIAMQSLQLKELLIPPNPFSSEDLAEWLNVASCTLRNARETLNDLIGEAASTSKQKAKEGPKASEEIENMRKKVRECQDKLQDKEKDLSFVSNTLELQYNTKKEEVKKVEEENRTTKEELEYVIKLKKSWIESSQKWKEKLEKAKLTEVDQRKQLHEELAKLKLDESKLVEYVREATLYAANRQQVFYQDILGIDIYADDSENVDSNNSNVE